MKLCEIHEAWTPEMHRKAYDEAHSKGYNAFKRGVHFDDNPFADDEIQHEGWEDGWKEAARDKAS